MIRRLFTVAFALLLLVQLGVGAAASLCRHEEGGQGHFGHHVHVHKVGMGSADQQDHSGGGDDPDCPQCHLACGFFPIELHAFAAIPGHAERPGEPVLRRSPPLPDSPERPRWRHRVA